MITTDRHGRHVLDIGFMPLVDSAPLLAAVRLGLDRRHGLQLRLHRQRSWAAIRDRLLSGELDVVQAMAPMVYGLQTGIGGVQADLAILMGLNQNGQAITLAPALASASEAGEALRPAANRLRHRLQFAQTFPTGTHALWLYHWLATQGLEAMHDIDVVTLPPPQMPAALARGDIDGYCAGEPWGAQAERLGVGRRVIRSGRLWPGHPEKVLACRRDTAAAVPEVLVALGAAVLEACRWLDEPRHHAEAAEWLAAPEAIDLPAAQLRDCLRAPEGEPADEALRFHADGAANFPWLSDGHAILQQFRRWRWLPPADAADDDTLVRGVQRVDLYRRAAALAGVALPAQDHREGGLAEPARHD